MLRCCDFYCANLLEGMEGTELLTIETSGNGPITTTALHKSKRDDAVVFDNKAKKAGEKKTGEKRTGGEKKTGGDDPLLNNKVKKTGGGGPVFDNKVKKTGGDDSVFDNKVKKTGGDDPVFDNKVKKKGGDVATKDNKEIENLLSSRETTAKEISHDNNKKSSLLPPPPSSQGNDKKKKKKKKKPVVVVVVRDENDESEKVDGSKETDDDDEEGEEGEEEEMMVVVVKGRGEEGEKDSSGSQCNDLHSNKSSNGSGEMEDEDVVSCSEEEEEEEENSVDNNTFNIINTENSESQEYSELTNDDEVSSPAPPTDSKSGYKENGDAGNFRENGGDSEFGTQTEEEEEESADEISCLEEEEEEVSEDSEEDIDLSSGGSDDGEESDDEEEDFDNDSLEEDGKSKTESTVSASSKGPTFKSKIPPPHFTSRCCNAPTAAAPTVAPHVKKAAKEAETKPPSPKFRHRPRLRSFGKKDTSEFKIEIFESKRKPSPLVPSISVPEDDSTTPGAADPSTPQGGRPLGGCPKDNAPAIPGVVVSAKPTDQLVTPDAPSSCSDFTTPDSADNTRSGLLDVSQPIGEESEESSDLHSPVRHPREEELLKKDSNRSLTDIERKASVNPDSKISPSATNTTTTTTSATAAGAISDDLTTGRSLPSGEKPRNGFISSSGGAPVTAANEGSSLSSSSVSSSSAPTGVLPPQQQNEERVESSQEVANSSGTPLEPKKPSPMAFTIELGGGGPGQSDAPKKLDITASISKWAPKHRRNLSLTKVEEHKKVEERVGKPPVGRPRSGTIGATGLFQGRRAGGYHSEGYFSSDQDDETPRRTADLKSPRSPRTPELRSPQTPQRLVRSTSQDSAKGASLKMRTPSPDSSSRASHTMTLNESASYLIEKMMSGTPETQRKQPGKTEGRTCCKAEKKPTVAEVTGRTKSEKGSKIATKMTPEARKQSTSANSLSSCQTYDVKLGLGSEPGKEEKDDVSEAGTYTIEKDSSSPEVEQARNDIDRVFGVSGTESEAEITPRGNVPSEEPFTTTPEADKFKSPSSLSRNSPNWIQQWAAQVAEHTKTPDSSKTILGSPRGSKPTLTSLSSSQESSESRPRRKLPTPPTHHHHLPYGMTSPRASDISDHESPTKGRLLRDLYDSPTPPPLGQPQSDSYGRDTESLLRDTEQLVTSLQARMEMKTGIRGSSFESHDSGGDSDLDTSTSYPINEDDDRLMKTFGAQQKTKLKLSGIDGTSSSSSRTPPVSASPRKAADSFGLDSRLNKLGGHFKRERSIVSDSGYDIYSASREVGGGEQCLQSDSSSEASEPLKDSRKTTDNNPPLKFNRAFSLRRARLGCDETTTATTTTTTPSKSSLPVEKKKLAQSPSVGNVPGTRKPLSSSKSHQSTRGDSQSQTSVSKSGANDFSRGDGGRFSLRLARSGSTNTVSKSPSHSSVRKELSNGIRRAAPRSNSTLSAKEVDFQNWKRRKNYDPMKAAAEGRKKLVEKKNEKNSQGNSRNSSAMRSPSPPGSLLRSASFHGTEGMGMSGRWPRKNSHLTMSEDDGPYSLEEEPQLVPHCSPLRRSPTSPHQLASPHITSPARQATIASVRARRSSYTHSDEGEGPASPSRKPSLDESGSEGKRSPLGSTRGAVSGRSKAKMEALDNLVISTIHSLSVKVRTTSETLLQKLKSQYDEEGDRAALLEEVLAHLSESDPTLSTSQSRSTSRELAGILRNLKKIEHALEVIDRVLVGVDDDDLDDDDDDLDGTVANEWGESDY
ncbi:dentin sialophosphoprotein-like isoform X10 [Macrobrachium rosenbergii]|uniref:dentin sialophosphoprotein-like isoform X10 n=1 Tax=Macrobrachium rosenbergii TaxID=79674 RepID=UPI0034D6EFE5